MDAYVDRVCAEVSGVRKAAERLEGPGLKPADFHATHRGLKPAANPKDRCAGGLVGVELPRRVDTIFLGGGTPSLLGAGQMRRLFEAVRGEFEVSAEAEVTLECAPGQLTEETLDEMLRQGMNRVSFGVQSFVDREAAAVGRLHTRKMCLGEIQRMRAAGVGEINVDLIVGLPHQTRESWRESVEVALGSGVPHVSVYMLEVDEGSRLGREMLGLQQTAGGRETGASRYCAAQAPSEDETAELYGAASEWLEAAGVRQYEISNFAREGFASGVRTSHRSRHNLKYWRREPYVGFGLDAHSMLRTGAPAGVNAVRWANTSDLEAYLAEGVDLFGLPGPAALEGEAIGWEQGFEEALFLGLRMNEGVELEGLWIEFGDGLVRGASEALGDVEEAGLVVREGGRLRLTGRGRMVSNEVFSRLLVGAVG